MHVHEPRLRWRVRTICPTWWPGSASGTCGAARSTCCSSSNPGTLLLHLGMSGSLRVLPADSAAPAARSFRSAARFRQHPAVQRSAPLRQPALHDRRSAPASAAGRARSGASGCRLQCGLSVAHHPPPAGRDQTAADEQQAGGRCWQHLRQRSAVQGTYPPERQARGLSRVEVGRLVTRGAHACSQARSASAARRCATTSAPTGRPGYFRQKLYVYERGPSRAATAARRSASSRRDSAPPTIARPVRNDGMKARTHSPTHQK